MSTRIKSTLRAVLNRKGFEGRELDAADREYLRRWIDNCAEDSIWEEIVIDALAYGLWPPKTLHSTLIGYALEARRLAKSVRAGHDPIYLERQRHRNEELSLATKADDLARYFEDVEKYSGIVSYYQRLLLLPVLPEQEAVPRIEPPGTRVRQVRQVLEQVAILLRKRAAREPERTVFISRKKDKRHVTAFIHLMTDYLDEFCGKQHRRAVAMLAGIAFDFAVDSEDVRRALDRRIKKSATQESRVRREKNVTNARGR